MAWFSFHCSDCGPFRKSLDRRAKTAPCPKCEKTSPLVLRPASVQVVERLDNGAMARSVERLHNIEEIMEERNEKSSQRVRDLQAEKDS